MDVPLLYSRFLDWQKNETGPFPGGDILCATGTIVIVPAENPALVVKIGNMLRTGAPTAQEEFKILARLRDKNIAGKFFALPAPVACGDNPDHCIMTYMGPCYEGGPKSAEIVAHAARALGEFAAKLYEADG